jgi:hypothetical protein
VLFTIVGLIALAFAVVMLVVRRNAAKKASASAAWPTTTGKITFAAVEAVPDRDGRRDMYRALVRYNYQANGREHAGDRVAWGGIVSSSSKSGAATIVGRYRVGQDVRVYYDPKDAAESVLEPTATGGTNALLFIAIIAAVVGVGAILLSLMPSPEAWLLSGGRF